MGRIGGRPYECVRRAWHSERHQPIRGSLIQEIFRIANEIHSVETKKNKEWQEKLPVVVLKAEEIIYSKANSEVEYVDLKTLCERVNDALNTIIRRDEGGDDGEFLQPCIEAALHLGCIPRRASRSQRNASPRFHLCPHITNIPTPENTNPDATFPLIPSYANALNPTVSFDYRYMSNKFPQNECFPSNSSCLVFPIYYGTYPQTEPLETSRLKMVRMSDPMSTVEDPQELECDLSLRLGPFSGHPGPCNAREGKKTIDLDDSYSEKSNGFPFFGMADSGSGPEFANVGPAIKKRKAMELIEEYRHCWQPTKLL